MTTWTKLKSGEWGLRGRDLAPGVTVTVSKKSGETQEVTVGKVLWTGDDGMTLATIAGRGNGGHRGRRSRVCRVCNHDEDECADMDCTCRVCGGMLR